MLLQFRRLLLATLAVFAFGVAAQAQLATQVGVMNNNPFCDATVTVWYQCNNCSSGLTPVTQVVPSGSPAFFASTCTTPVDGWATHFDVDYGFGSVTIDLDPCSFISSSGGELILDCQPAMTRFEWTTTPVLWVPGTLGSVFIDLY